MNRENGLQKASIDTSPNDLKHWLIDEKENIISIIMKKTRGKNNPKCIEKYIGILIEKLEEEYEKNEWED